jgi:hypothetical protein
VRADQGIDEDGDRAAGLVPRLLQEVHALLAQCGKVALEVLVWRNRNTRPPPRLPLRGRCSAPSAFASSRRVSVDPGGGDQHPTLGIAEARVLDQVETERADMERDRLVVVGDDEGVAERCCIYLRPNRRSMSASFSST